MKNMRDERVNQVGIVGTGTMGSGIAQVCLMAGYEVTLYDLDEEKSKLAQVLIIKNIKKWASRKKIEERTVQSTINNLIIGTELMSLKDCDVIIEAIAEKLDYKRELFGKLEKVVSPTTILASNTSGISISLIAKNCEVPGRVIGTHFFNPAPIMPVVELIQGDETTPETLKETSAFIRNLQKTVVVAKDVPGFIVNRIITPMLNEAMRSYEQGVATKNDIDVAMKQAMNHPMGPLELSDYIGLDVLLNFMDHVYEETRNSAYQASDLLREMVDSGNLGVKSGKGFYKYEKK